MLWWRNCLEQQGKSPRNRDLDKTKYSVFHIVHISLQGISTGWSLFFTLFVKNCYVRRVSEPDEEKRALISSQAISAFFIYFSDCAYNSGR
jgi:hypothetical protein